MGFFGTYELVEPHIFTTKSKALHAKWDNLGHLIKSNNYSHKLEL